MEELYLNIDAEQAVLGCLLQDNTTWDEINDYLQVDDFSLPFYRDVYRTIKDLVINNKPVDLICVSQLLKNKNNEKNDESLAKLGYILQSQFVPKNVKHYAEIVKQKNIDRKILTVAQDIIVSVNQKKENRLDYAQQRISEIAD